MDQRQPSATLEVCGACATLGSGGEGEERKLKSKPQMWHGLCPCDINPCREQLQKLRRNSVSGVGRLMYCVCGIVLAVLLAYMSLL